MEVRTTTAKREGIGFIPWFPVAFGELASRAARWPRRRATRGDRPAGGVGLAAAPVSVMLPIPGNGSVAHVEENLAAGALRLEPAQVEKLDAAA